MKHTLDITLPEGYEVDEQILTTEMNSQKPMVFITTKKKNTKDFAFYVDEYLRSDYNTTNDMLCNWFDKDQLEKIGNNLKQNKLQFVPWEIKIGLIKFICKDCLIPWGEYIHQFNGSVYANEINKANGIIPDGFRDEVILN